MLVNNIRPALVIALAMAVTQLVSAQDYDKPIKPNWPRFPVGYTQGFFGNGKVDLMGMVSDYVADLEWLPDYYRLGVTYEQALSFAEHVNARSAILHDAWVRLHQAEQEGDEEAIRAALRHESDVLTMVTETAEDLFREMLVRTFDEAQLETIKSMCINVALNHVSLRDLFHPGSEQLSQSALTEKELAELRRATAEVELEMLREVMELRRRAWDKVMAKVPAELVKKLEDQRGFGGLVKPN